MNKNEHFKKFSDMIINLPQDETPPSRNTSHTVTPTVNNLSLGVYFHLARFPDKTAPGHSTPVKNYLQLDVS